MYAQCAHAKTMKNYGTGTYMVHWYKGQGIIAKY